MKRTNQSIKRSLLAVLLATTFASATHAQISSSSPRHVDVKATAFSDLDSYDPGRQYEEFGGEGLFYSFLTQSNSLAFVQVAIMASQVSDVANSGSNLVVSGNLHLHTSLITELPPPTVSSGANEAVISNFNVRFNITEPCGFMLSATTTHGQPGLDNGANVTFRGTGIDDIVIGHSPGNSVGLIADGPDSGTASGQLTITGGISDYTLSAVVYDSSGVNNDPRSDHYENANTVVLSFEVRTLTALPEFVSFNYNTATPNRDNNPWTFSAVLASSLPGLTIEVQSTLTPEYEGSWAPLPGNANMTGSNSNWTLTRTAAPTVPVGDRYFRAVASSPFALANVVSETVGRVVILGVFSPFSVMDFDTANFRNGPFNVGAWAFYITLPACRCRPDVPDTSVGLQWSANPNDPNPIWMDLHSNAVLPNMIEYPDSQEWAIYTPNVPSGTISFRAVASAPAYVDLISDVFGPIVIGPALPIVSNTVATSGTTSLADYATTPAGFDVKVALTGCSTHTFAALAGTTTTLASPVTFYSGDACSQGVVAVPAGATAAAPGMTAGDGVTIANGGTIKANAALVSHDGGSLVSHDGGSVISNDGGTAIAKEAAMAQNAKSSDMAKAGNPLFGNGSGTVKPANGTGFVGPSGGPPPPPPPPPPQPPPPQPTFTGLMTIDGNYSQFAGSLIIGIAGTNTASQGAQQYDQLVVSGRANLAGGRIAFVLLDPNNQTNLAGAFQPPDGATFDVLVASNIILTGSVQVQGPIWGDGQFFNANVVTRPDGLQAVRLVATHVPPRLFLLKDGDALQLTYPANYTGYSVQSTPTLSPPNWATFSTDTNVVILNPTNASGFFRLSKP